MNTYIVVIGYYDIDKPLHYGCLLMEGSSSVLITMKKVWETSCKTKKTKSTETRKDYLNRLYVGFALHLTVFDFTPLNHCPSLTFLDELFLSIALEYRDSEFRGVESNTVKSIANLTYRRFS